MDNRVTKVGVITDAHANLPATLAALAALDAEHCDVIVHMGDAIGIGPHPAEVLELLLSRPDIICLMGNHDELFALDQLDSPPYPIAEGELRHQRWVHSQLPAEWRPRVRAWPYQHRVVSGTTSILFQHYAREYEHFCPISQQNLPHELDAVFQPDTDLVFFGHHHPRADVQGNARYINPGALGTNPGEGARYAIIESQADGTVTVSFHAAAYDADSVRRDMRVRDVPEAEFILRGFLGD